MNDVLIARSGSFGKASIYLEPEVVNSADIIIVESDDNKINPFYLVSFLNSKLGTNQLFRFASGGVQGHVNLTILENLLIPTLKDEFQVFLELLIKQSYKLLKHSQKHYQQSENLLLSELGLKDWQPTEETVAVKSFAESFLSSSRLDAEYYQPKYDQIEAKIKSYSGGWTYISDVLARNIKNGTTPKEVNPEVSLNSPRFIRAEAFNQFLEVDTEKLYSVEKKIFEKHRAISVRKDDVLVSMTGTIGNVAIYSTDEPAIINQNIVMLTCKKTLMRPLVLALYIKSVGRSLLIRQQTGNVQPYVNISNFQNLIVPLLSQKAQDDILDLLVQSSLQRTKSKQLLEIAKISVERAIEADEESAIAWINQQLENIGVALD